MDYKKFTKPWNPFGTWNNEIFFQGTCIARNFTQAAAALADFKGKVFR